MTKKITYLVLCCLTAIFIAIFGLAACQGPADVGFGGNRLLVWHGWSTPDAVELRALIDNFSRVNPNVEVIVVDLDAESLRQAEFNPLFNDTEALLLARYKEQAGLGLGPDLLLGPSDWVRELADAGLIQDLNGQGVDTSQTLSTAVETLYYQPSNRAERGLYGLPLTLDTTALLYNKTLIEEPATTLDDLLRQAREGKKVGLDISFDAAFWGVKAFGGQLFDQEGRVTLDRGGFANWLTWLKNAQSESNIILDSDETTLLALFQEEEVAYIAGRLDMLPQLQQSLGEDAIGVVPLPGGPNNASGPFLRTQALMLNRYAADAQEKLALQLAQFLTNAEQQTHLLRRTGRVPANTRVRVDPIVFPLAAGFSAQTKTAVPVVNLPQMEAVFSDGNEAFLQTLTGVVEPNEAARQFTDRINSQFGFEPIEVDLVDNCRISGTLQVWHRWTTEPESSALSELASRFERRCPNTTIELTTYETADLFETYTTVGGQAEGPDLIIGPSDWIVPWADQGLINSLDGLLEVDELQQYISTAQVALQVNERVYGLPLALNLLALYYKANLVTDPPRVLDDLVTGATIDRPVVIPIDFYYGSWGALAFGSITYDEGNQPDLNPDGFTAWLQWLQQAQTNPGIILSPDPAEVEPLFSDGPAAYYVGEAAHLTQLQQAVGRANLRVVPLPAGPADEARPPLTAEGVMINPAALMVQDQAALALEFARYVTNLESQTYLMERANRIPSHVNVEAIAYPAISGFLEQTKTASVWPNTPELNRWQLLIDDLYNQVIFGEADAVEAVETLVSQLENETE